MAKNSEARGCNGCTACCDGWLETNVDGCQVSAGHPCKHITRDGCSIYSMRPENPCVGFRCGWVLDDDMPDWLKPSISKVIVKLHNTWQRPDDPIQVHLAIAVGPRIPGKTKTWLRNYVRENSCDFLCVEHVRDAKTYTGGLAVFGLGSPGFEQKVKHWTEAGHTFTTVPS